MHSWRCVAVSVILKVGMLTEATEDILGAQLRSRFVFDAGLVSVGMVASILGALILVCCMAIMQLIEASRLPLLKLVDSRSQPDMPLAPGHRWHMFLSHSLSHRVEPPAARPSHPAHAHPAASCGSLEHRAGSVRHH